ncbi:MAG: hypothetical protein IPL33_05165 [Sphingobacteriales bacterium]|nr:hypothetical protein [Sphingobacteriales bacterium]
MTRQKPSRKRKEWDNGTLYSMESNEAKGYQIYTTKTEVPFKFQLTNTPFVKTYNTGTKKSFRKQNICLFDQDEPFNFLMENESQLFLRQGQANSPYKRVHSTYGSSQGKMRAKVAM